MPDGKVVVAFDGLDARYLAVPSGKVLGVITAGTGPGFDDDSRYRRDAMK